MPDTAQEIMSDLRGIFDLISCGVAYLSLLVSGLMSLMGMFAPDAAAAIGFNTMKLIGMVALLQALLGSMTLDDIAIGVVIDIGAIFLGLIPGAVLRREGVMQAILCSSGVAFLMLVIAYPALHYRCSALGF